MKKFIKKNKKEIGVILLSILILIIGIFVIGFILSLIIVLLADTLYFYKDIKKLFNGKKYKKKPASRKNSIDYKINNKYKSTNKKLVSNNSNNKKKKESTKKKDSKKKKIWKKIILIFIILCGVGFVLGVIAMLGFCYYIVDNAPEFNPEALYTSEPTIIYDKDGNEIERLGTEQRIIIDYEEIPEVLVNAIIATEDSQFFQHNGVDIKRFTKASIQQLMGIDAGGASTITMQLSKNTYTSKETSIVRKFTDVYLAVFKIESAYTKEDILKFYVNSYFMGGGYGVEQTSLTYFGKSAKDLNIAEAAMIAGLFQAPGKYNPYTNPEATEKRRQTVLKLMLRHGYITKAEYDIAYNMTVDKIVKNTNTATGEEISEYQSFIDAVVKEVREKTNQDPYSVSMKIYTTMDTEKQKYITDIMNGKTYEWENDVVKAGVAVIDVKTGAIVALGGGRNVNIKNSLNYATDINRQIGSTAKPLYDYAPAIEFMNWNTYTILADEPITYSDGKEINNWDGGFQGFITMRRALTLSRNIPALKAFKANNKNKILSFVTSLGLSPETPLHEAHAIGGYNGESPLTMAAAYSSFANGGYYTTPYTFTKIEYDNGKTYDNTQLKTKVMSEQTAYMVTSMLIDTAQYALGNFANINNQQYGAKTGTTNYDTKTLEAKGLSWSGAVNDLWTVGFNTDYAIGVWYGYDEINSTYYNKLSSNQHTRLFQTVGKGIFNNNKTFTMPDNVSAVAVEYGCPTACLPSEYTPGPYKSTELFIKGTEPTTVSDRFDKLQDISNLKASASGTTVTLAWSPIKTPRALDSTALTEYFKNTFQTSFLSSHVNLVLNDNKTMFGSVVYKIYVKNTDGSLSLLATTPNSTYKLNNQNGEKTYVVKTAYLSFEYNMSSGKSVTIRVNNQTTPVNTNKENFIKQLYTNCLGRSATNDEINSWSSNSSASTIAIGICDSTEAKNKYNSANTAIPSFYKGILERSNTANELSTQTSKYNSEGRTSVIKNIINSQEFKTYCSSNSLTYTSI